QNFTDSAPNSLHDIGTLKPTSGNRLDGPLTGIDTPTLRGIWSTAPYLHDGSATTLEEAVAAHSTLALSGGELTQLATYLRQIDGNEPGPTSNQPPVLTNPGVQSNAVGDSVNLPLSASDADGDSLTFSATGLPNGISINTGTGAIAGTATTAGSFDVTVSVNDGKGGIDSASFGWAVNAPANQPPVLINPGAQSNTVGDSVNLSLSASDADGDSLTFSATGLPNGISINTGTGAIAGTATTAGNFDVTLSVSDGKGGIDSATFTWMVIEQPVSSCGGLVQEAETATLYGDFAVVPDVNASGGQAIGVPVGVRAATTPDATQRVEFCVYVDTAGAYNLNALVYAPSNSSNSFYVQVDGQPTPAQRWNLATDENSYQLAVAPLTLNLAAGEHVITILHREAGTLLDRIELQQIGGGTSTDQCSSGLEQEAENASLFGAFTKIDDGAASGGQAVVVPDGFNDTANADATNRIEFCLTVGQAGSYTLQGWILAPDAGSNSLFVQVDGAPAQPAKWSMPVNGSYQPLDAPLSLALTTGQHQVTIIHRETGTRVDKVVLQPANVSGSSLSITEPRVVYNGDAVLDEMVDEGLSDGLKMRLFLPIAVE
ncbi:MAG: putative Ig domain-containing protein, partial [Caldilineaceae bacterium]|nr:putative Ig domain-containing protein [Caldilineaceae bacterium]